MNQQILQNIKDFDPIHRNHYSKVIKEYKYILENALIFRNVCYEYCNYIDCVDDETDDDNDDIIHTETDSDNDDNDYESDGETIQIYDDIGDIPSVKDIVEYYYNTHRFKFSNTTERFETMTRFLKKNNFEIKPSNYKNFISNK